MRTREESWITIPQCHGEIKWAASLLSGGDDTSTRAQDQQICWIGWSEAEVGSTETIREWHSAWTRESEWRTKSKSRHHRRSGIRQCVSNWWLSTIRDAHNIPNKRSVSRYYGVKSQPHTLCFVIISGFECAAQEVFNIRYIFIYFFFPLWPMCFCWK